MFSDKVDVSRRSYVIKRLLSNLVLKKRVKRHKMTNVLQ